MEESRLDIELRLTRYLEGIQRPVGRRWECLRCGTSFTLQCEPSDVPSEWWTLRPGASFPHPWETKRVADLLTFEARQHQKECPWTCPTCGEFTSTVPKE